MWMKEKNVKTYVTGHCWLSFAKLTNALHLINKSRVMFFVLNVLRLRSFKPYYMSMHEQVGVLESWRMCTETQLKHRVWIALFWLNWLWLQSTLSRNVRLQCWTSLSLVVWLCSSQNKSIHRLSHFYRRLNSCGARIKNRSYRMPTRLRT